MSDEGGETIAEARRVKTGTSRAVVVFSALAFVGLVVDLWSKHVAFDPNFVPGPRRPIAGGWATFELTTSFNEGALFGVGQGWTWLFALLSLVAVAGVFFWMFRLGGRSSAWLTVALGLILAGTLGNLYDRAGCHGEVYPEGLVRAGQVRYAVRDFFLFTFGQPETPIGQRYHYPVFNFADVFLVTGAIMLVLKSFQAEEDDERDGAGQERQAAASDDPAGAELTTPAASPGTIPPDPPGSPPEVPTS
jgi:signal peptidase II